MASIPQQVLAHYGFEHQSTKKLPEEISEFFEALFAWKHGEDSAEHVLEEIVDCQELFEQVRLHFDKLVEDETGKVNESRSIRLFKRERTMQRIKNES